MVAQKDFPDEWVCDDPDAGVRVQIRVPNRVSPRAITSGAQEPDETSAEAVTSGAAADTGGSYTWIEIPTTSVEQWTEKGEAASIQRTAKVRFPSEWGQDSDELLHNSPRRLVQQFEPTDSQPFMFARIYWYSGDQWVLGHMGWIGGVGSSADNGVHKMWVYDMAEILSSVPVTERVQHPTINQYVELLATETNERTPIPVSNAVIVPPDSPADFEYLAEEVRGEDVTRGEATQYFAFALMDAVQNRGISPETQSISDIPDGLFTAITLDTGTDFFGNETGAKTFTANHDTMQTMYDWFEKKTGGKIHFEPLPDSVVLYADIAPSRRIFVADNVLNDVVEGDVPDIDPSDYTLHDTVHVLRNDALYEMKPTNTVHLRGEVSSQPIFNETAGGALQQFGESVDLVLENFEAPTKKYPVVIVESPPLVQAAEGVSMSPPVVDSDATELDEARDEAVRKLRQELEEPSEGSIRTRGNPYMMPYDRLDTYEVCNERVEYEQTPVAYEIESVKHVKEAGDVYKTRLNVSIWANEEDFEFRRSEMVELSGEN